VCLNLAVVRRLRGPALAAVAMSMSCAAILGIESPVVDAGGEGGSLREGGSEELPEAAPDVDSGADADADASPVRRDDAGCPIGRGPSMIAFPVVSNGARFCIDRTEVTYGQWTAFRDAAVPPSGQRPDCAWNAAFPDGDPSANPAFGDTTPVTSVNWCDAVAFCSWSGKTLCGALADGGPLGPGFGPADARWAYACTNRGTTTYPYGNVYQNGACNIDVDAGGNTFGAGSLTSCVTNGGAFDMVGNAWEWVDRVHLQDAGPGHDTADFVGGEFGSPAAYACGAVSGLEVAFRGPRVGFRCCADLP
jgi:formylglycine-generating enzyme